VCFVIVASHVNHYDDHHQQQQQQQSTGVADDVAFIENTAEPVNDAANVSRGQSTRSFR